ncbi:hypothetical protein ECSTECDG1313_5556 [Escherichia coli STEC_DG131-3]|nr:hypothetical protein ECSTECDG1313_5556 [Escherichia coli STEC_DG131-3]
MILTSLLTILTIKEATRTYKTYKSNRLTPVSVIAYAGLGYMFCFTTGIYELSSTRLNPVISDMLMSFLSRLSIMLPVTLAEIAVIISCFCAAFPGWRVRQGVLRYPVSAP